MSNRYSLGLVGSLMLMFGVFAPLVQIPFIGTQTYFQNGRGDGVLVLALGVLSLLLTFARRYRGLLVTALISLAILALTYISFQSRLAQIRADMNEQLANNPFRGIGDAMLGSVQLQWGWALLLGGGVILLLAGAGTPSSTAQQEP